MRKLVSVLVVVAVVAVLAPAWADDASGGLRYTVTVTKFENQAGWHAQWDLGDAWGAVLTDLLNQTGRFIVLGESDMREAAMDEQDFAASGRTAGGGKAPVTGQMTPAQILVKGAITHVQDNTAGGGGGVAFKGVRLGGRGGKAEINATIYMVDSTTGQILASKSVTGVAKKRGIGVGYTGGGFSGDFDAFKNDNVGKAVMAACDEAVAWMMTELPNVQWTGTVVMNRDGRIYINRGEREGVSPGQTFVVGEAEVIRDPDTGEVLDEFMNKVATLKVDSVKEKLSVCSVIDGDAAAVDKGMAVHLP